MKDPIKILTLGKNQVCTPHRSIVTYNLNGYSCCMLLSRGLIHLKIKVWKSPLKLMYIVGFFVEPIEILTLCKNQVCTPHKSTVTCYLNSHSCCMLFNRSLMYVKIENVLWTLCTFLVIGWINDPIEMATSCNNEICTPHKIWVTYNLNSHTLLKLGSNSNSGE